jgi:ABC-type transporter Mla subunit MlaD
MSFRESKGLWLGIGGAAIALAALLWLLVSGGPRTLVILFPDAGDLKKEDPVLWHDYEIGRVVKIEPLVDNQIGVSIRINEDYARKITRGSRFTLKRAALFGFVGSNSIIVETTSESVLPYLEGEKVQGISPPKPTLVEESKQRSSEYWQQLKDQAAELLDQYRKSPYRKEVEDALSELKALAEAGSRQAQEGLTQFRKDHQKEFDAVMRKLEEARDWIRKKGDEAGARRIQREIDRLKK